MNSGILRVFFLRTNKIKNVKANKSKIEELAYSLMVENEYVKFYMASYGAFAKLLISAIKDAQNRLDDRNSAIILFIADEKEINDEIRNMFDEAWSVAKDDDPVSKIMAQNRLNLNLIDTDKF